MFKRFIIATEWSADADRFIENLRGLKALGAEECLLIVSYRLPYPAVLEEASIAIFAEIPQAVEQHMAVQKQMLEKQGFTVEAKLVEGLNKKELVTIALENDYETVVVGARKQSKWDELFTSGITYEIVHQSDIPVLIIRLPEEEEQGKIVSESLIDHILYPTDFSIGSTNALEYVKQLVAQGAKKVTLVHIQDKDRVEPDKKDRLEEFNAIDRERLIQMKELLQGAGDVEVDIMIGYGNPSVEILRLIDEKDVRLCVMGSQGRGFVKELFLGGVSHNIARQSECSVLLIPVKR